MEEATKKRNRTDQEVKSIINYLLENRDFERPSASLYYFRFLKQNEMLIDYEQVIYKVKNLKIIYKKRKAWECSTGAGVFQEGGGNIKDELKRRFPYYEDLDEIFGCPKKLADQSDIIVLDSLIDAFSLSDENALNEPNVLSHTVIISSPSTSSNQIQCSPATPTNSSAIPSLSKKKSRQKTSIDDLVETQKNRLEHQKLKLELKKEKFEFPKEKFSKKQELKKLKLEMNGSMKIRELELMYNMRGDYVDNDP